MLCPEVSGSVQGMAQPSTSSSLADLLTPAEVAALIRSHRRTVVDLIHAGAFPNAINKSRVVGNGARYLIPRADVDRYLQSLKVTAA